MVFSAVIASIGGNDRSDTLSGILEEICNYNLLDEVIIIWQNSDAPPEDIFREKVRVFHCPIRAVSLARNLGASLARGRWIWFLDDDTRPADGRYLDIAREALEGNELDFVTSNVSGEGAGQVCSRISSDVIINERTIAGNFWEPGLIVRREIFLKTRYDICLGPGCLHGSSEGSDLGLRLIRSGYRGYRLFLLDLNHPRIVKSSDYRNKMFLYAIGNGLVAVRHGGWSGFFSTIAKAVVGVIRAFLSWNWVNAADYLARICGLLAGPLLLPRPPVGLDSDALALERLLTELQAQTTSSI